MNQTMNNLNLVSPINFTSYGLTGSNIVQALSKKVQLSLFPIGGEQYYPEHFATVQECKNNAHFFDAEAPCIRLWHQFALNQFAGKGPTIGYTIFELDEFKDVEKHHCQWTDQLWVCSAWAKSIVEKYRKNDVKIVPLGIDPTIFTPQPPSQNDKYTFFNLGKIEIRKGHDIIYKLFKKAFPNEQDVQLVMAFDCPISPKSRIDPWKKLYKDELGDRVSFIERVPSQQDLVQILKDMDCGLFPSRAEGWNLPLLESICLNKPVITTFYSGHTEFCTEENSYLVSVDELEKAYDGRYFMGDGNWAKIGKSQEDQIIQYMRYCYENKIKENTGAVETAKKYNWTNTADCILRNLNGYY